MKKQFKFLLVISIMLIAQNSYSRDYICYYMLNAEIRRTMEENEVQKDMRKEQAVNLSLETYNEEEWSKFRKTMEKIKSRLQSVSFALQAIPTSVKITQEIKKTYDIQEKIYNELKDAPAWIPLALGGQIDFVGKLEMNIRLVSGIVLSYGTINQMEKAERGQLLDFATQEFRNLRQHSWYTLSTIKTAKRKWIQRQNILKSWVNKDKKIIQDIIRNANKY